MISAVYINISILLYKLRNDVFGYLLSTMEFNGMKSSWTVKSVIAASLFASNMAMAEIEISGEMLAQTCSGCHGTMGKSNETAFIPLAGMDKAHFIQAMASFASGERETTLMGTVARGFSEAEVARMADYFATQQP